MINTVSITDLKQNTSKVIKLLKNKGVSVIVLQRSKVAAVLVEPSHYDALEDALEDLADLKTLEERKGDKTIAFDEYFAKRFGKNTKKKLDE